MREVPKARTPDPQLFRDVFNASPIGIVVENLEGQLLFVNPAFCSMLGFSEEELRLKHCVDFSPPEDAEKDWELFQQLRAGAIDHYQLEKRYFRSDGSLLWGRLSLSLLNSRPSPMVIAMVEDITDKKTAEEVRFRHAAIVESSEDAIISGTLDGIIVSWNAGAQRIYGYTEAEAVGRSITILAPPESPDEENKILETLRTGGCIEHFETLRVTKAGKRINISLTISPIRDSSDRTVGISGIARDITERKRAEEAIKENEQRFRLVADNAPVMIWMSGLDKRPTYFNRLWLDFTGLSETDLQNDLGGIVHPEDYQKCHETYCRGFDQRQPFKKECRLRRRDGQYRWMLDIGVPRFQDGSFAGYIGSCVDITDQKLAEESLSSISRQLIEAQERERTRIARDMHDDINQRVAVVAMELDRQGQNLQASADELRRSIADAYKQISELASDIHLMSHGLHSSKLDSLGLAAAAKSFCWEFAERQNVEVKFNSERLPGKMPEAISLCLFRVLQEALQNAMKHSGERYFRVSLVGSTNQIALTVCDEGRGFRPEAVLPEGGLGLTSMRERLKLVGGMLDIDSKPSQGTTIRAFVPLKPQTESTGAGI
jgi:PAS domain S-box-containing protein